MKTNFILFVLLISISTIGFSLGGNSVAGEEVVQISAEELNQLMPDKDFTLLNVHIPLNEIIPGTDLNIPYNEIEGNIQNLPGKNDPLVIYCRSGSMSKTAYRKLVELGFQNILELDGGYNAWSRAGYELTAN